MGSKLDQVKEALAKYVAGEAEPHTLRDLPGMNASIWTDNWTPLTKTDYGSQREYMKHPFEMPDEAPPLLTLEVWHTMSALHRRVPFDKENVEYTHERKDIANWSWKFCKEAVTGKGGS